MDCPTRRRKNRNSISSEEDELRKMSRVSWIQDHPQGTNLQQQQQQQQQQQVLDHHQMTLRFHHHHQHQQQQQQQQRGDEHIVVSSSPGGGGGGGGGAGAAAAAAAAALSLQQRAMAAIALQEIRSSMDPSKLVQQHRFHQPVSTSGSSSNLPVTPMTIPSPLHCVQSMPSIPAIQQHPSPQQNQHQNPTFGLYPPPPMLPLSPLATGSEVPPLDPIPIVSCPPSSKMMLPYPQMLMSGGVPPVIFPPSLVTPSTSPPVLLASSKPAASTPASRAMTDLPLKSSSAAAAATATATTTTTKWFTSPPPFQQPSGALAASLPGTGMWRGSGDFGINTGIAGGGLDHQQHHHRHYQELVENNVVLDSQPSSGCFAGLGGGVSLGSSMMMPPGSLRSSSSQPLSPLPAGVDQVIADLKNIVSSSCPDSCLVSDTQPKTIPSQQQQQQCIPRQRTFTKVYKLGSIGRAVDVARFKNYVELRAELSRMFGLDGQLDQRNGWQLVFVDKENDLLLVGDDPWEEFVRSVRGIRILSPSEVSYYTSDERSAEVV